MDIKKIMTRFFLVIGIISFTFFVVGLLVDIRSFDETKGGYESPYENYTGQPINFSALDQTHEGILGRGYVIDFHMNCSTGMISVELFKQKINYRVVSERAIKVHKPREACLERGFVPLF